jgi:CdiI immunity protein
MQKPEALDHLMGAYFHQDWVLDHPDEWAVLAEFERDEPTLAAELPAEIDRVLQHFDSEAELEHYIVRVLGGDFNAAYKGGTYRTWLQQIADHVRRATSA